MFICFREGRSNAHIKGDYQRIGDVMLKNFQGLKVRPLSSLLHVYDDFVLMCATFKLYP